MASAVGFLVAPGGGGSRVVALPGGGAPRSGRWVCGTRGYSTRHDRLPNRPVGWGRRPPVPSPPLVVVAMAKGGRGRRRKVKASGEDREALGPSEEEDDADDAEEGGQDQPPFDMQGPLAPELFLDADAKPKEDSDEATRKKRRRRKGTRKPSAGQTPDMNLNPKHALPGGRRTISIAVQAPVGAGRETLAGKASGAKASDVDRSVRKLTSAFKLDKKTLQEEITIDPDFVIAQKQADSDYDLTAALIGRGSRTKDFGYTLPYIQNGLLIGLLVILLCTFVYDPGFPLTDLPEESRDTLKKGLALTYSINTVLAGIAFFAARERNQSPLFWTPKVLLLGCFALNELIVNIPKVQRTEE